MFIHMLKNIIYKTRWQKYGIFLLFILMALTSILIPWHTGYIFSGSDLRFHINRIMEIVCSSFKYPLENFYTFNRVGYGVNTFYPILTLYPLAAVFKMVANPINAFYIVLMCLLVVTELCSYFAARLLKLKRKNSIMFSVIYSFSGYIAFVYWFAFELGEILAFAVLPLLIPATLSFLCPLYVSQASFKYRVPFFVITLAWITYSHLLTTLMCLALLSVLFICDLLIKPTLIKLLLYMRLAILYFLVTSFYWINFIKAYLDLKIIGPEKYLNVLNVTTLLENSLNNNMSAGNLDPMKIVGIGIVPIVLLIYLLANYQELTSLEKYFLWLALFFLVLSSNLFCWQYFREHIPNITVIQFTFRFLIFVVLFTSLCATLFVKPNTVEVILLVVCIGIINVNQLSAYTTEGMAQPTFVKRPSNQYQPTYADFKVNRATFSNLYKGVYNQKGGAQDYLTRDQNNNFKSIVSHQVYNDSIKKIKVNVNTKTNSANYEFYQTKTSSVDLPILISEQRVIVRDNGNVVKTVVDSRRGTLQLPHIKGQENHKIDINILPSKTFYLSIISTIVGLFYIIYNLFALSHKKDASQM